MPTTRRIASTITTISTVAIPATDQDRTVEFFVERLGFEPLMDAELQPGFRWIEVGAPGSPVSVAIVAASATYPSGVDTGIRFVTSDAVAEHAALSDLGVDVDELLRWPGVPTMFEFRDLDGNVFYMAEPS